MFPLPVRFQVRFSNFLSGYEAIMFFGNNGNPIFALLKLKEGDQIAFHELSADRPTDQVLKLARAHRHILLDLDDAQAVISAFCLHRKHIVDALFVDANIDFVGLDLTKLGNRRPEMILSRWRLLGPGQRSITTSSRS